MRISIANRFRPFSHTPGTRCLLPGSSYCAQIFPTRIVIDSLSSARPERVVSLDLNLLGFVKDFTIEQDLEKGQILIFGIYKEGFLRFSLTAGKGGDSFQIKIDRCPQEGVLFSPWNIKLHRAGAITFVNNKISDAPFIPVQIKTKERLSLGCHKAQDWDLVMRRCDLVEILPFWFRLGKIAPEVPCCGYEGTLKLLKMCKETSDQKEKLAIYQALCHLFRAGFEGILSPRLFDDQFQGFGVNDPPLHFKGSPLLLLREGAEVIKELFVQVKEKELSILPLLPPEFHAGRFIDVDCGPLGELDIEWSKKTIRRMVIKASESDIFSLHFQKNVKSFRLRTSLKDKGVRLVVQDRIAVTAGSVYLFDNFQK